MAAAKLCCAAPHRSESPDDMPSRPVRHFKSLANVKTHFAHSKHALVTTDGPTDRVRPLYPADDLELQRIFVTASLPEDHPDALRLGHRKPDVDESIIHSPSFTNKLRRQLSRKSLVTDKPNKEATRKSIIRPFAYSRKRKEYGLTDLAGGYDDDAHSLCLTGSRLASLEDHDDTDDGMIPSKREQQVECLGPIDLCALPPDEPRRSISVPPIPCSADAVPQPKRSQSSSNTHRDFKNALTVHLPGPTFIDANEIWPSSPTTTKPQHTQSSATCSSTLPPLQISQLPLFMPSRSQLLINKSRSSGKHKIVQKESAKSLHLNDMQISLHLRTKSQVSDASTVSDSDGQSRNKHASLNSIMLSTLEPARCKSISSFGFAASIRSPTWEQVLEDDSSSIYSRRTSTAQEALPMLPVEQSSGFSEETIRGDLLASGRPELRSPSKANTPLPVERIVSASTGISILTSNPASHSEVRLSASPGSVHVDQPVYNTTCSLPKIDSSGSLGKLSKFREDLNDSSTVKKCKKKRRSVLRILFPNLTRSELRSTSTPLLGDKTQFSLKATYDGTGDTQDLLSVPQSFSKPHSGQRAISFAGRADLRPPSPLSTGSLVVTPSLQSRQSMVNYERSLSITGDKRRRKSTLGELRSHEPEIEDQDNDPEIALHRASPLLGPGRKGTEEALMEKALQQHQLEKAAFLRPSKQKLEVTPSSSRAPVFTSPFGFPSTSESRLSAAAADDLDPLEAEGPSAARRSQSMQDLGPSQGAAGDLSMFRKRKRSTIWTMNTVTTKGTRAHLHAMTPPRTWSRYPSHTRERRCSTAGRHDGIVARDFAYLEDPRNVHQAVSLEEITGSPKSWPHLANTKRRNWIVKSRSMTFGTVFRYYSNLLTSSAARNRRSSITTSGRLEHPELEVLPPLLPLHSDVPQYLGAKDQLVRAVNHIKDTTHHIKEEGLDVLGNHHHNSTPCMNEYSIRRASPTTHQSDRSEGVHHRQEASESGSSRSSDERTISSGMVDGVVESRPPEPGRALSARRLSRMYQACVQLPASLDNTEVERSGVTDDSICVSDGLATAGLAQVDSGIPNTGLLTVPATKSRMYSGPVTRHFPSVTVVDDRKGHWRSVSLMSVDSGKSVRRSTRDLLEAVKVTQTRELEKLLGTSGVLVTEGEDV